MNLLQSHPVLATQWHPKLNVLDVCQATYGSKKKVWWICNKGHEWQSSISNRTLLGNGCPYCAGQRPTAENCLLATHPHLVKCWSTRNKLKPMDVMGKSNKKALWVCPQGHEWEELISNMTRHNNGCPYCSGHRVCRSNCVATTHPELLKEWDEENHLTLYELTAGSNIKLKWKCKLCNYRWSARVGHRSDGHGCPRCRQSQGEMRIERYLESKSLRFTKQHRFDSCRNKRPLPFDFVVETVVGQKAIEYQGEQHFRPIYGEAGFKQTQENDLIKSNWCKSNDVPFLLIIYSDFSSIEEKLAKFLL